ncbi:MAG: tripartite tricarboxylate transporter substrate binding protein [Betaproteobacteria bacterium]|nr:tripartite tricarboxylate transporter substrate binding protein [Betaproteobacteria bacterium]
MRTDITCMLLGCIGVALAANAAHAQNYPDRPIRFIVPQSAGGSTDKVARVVAQELSEVFGQTIVVDNRPGSGSLNGTELAARATPDGYTLLVVAASFSISPAVRKKLPFDVVRDFAPITQLVDLQHLLVVHPSVPAKSVKDVIALAKAKPGELNYASSGIATSTHMAAELFRYMTKTNMTHVPYKGGGPGITAMLAGQCHLYFATISTALPHVRAGKLRGLAVTGAKRSVAAPDLPTVAEAGVPGYVHSSWIGMAAPAKTPPPVLARLHAESVKVVQSPQVKSLFLRDGLESLGNTPQQFAADLKQEIAKWRKVVAAAGIQAN